MRRAFDSLSRGLLLITLGIIFFLINYGKLTWSFWVHAVDLWPLVLILAGVGLLLNRRIPFSAVILTFLLCMVGYSLVVGDRPTPWLMNTPFQHRKTETKPLNVSLPSDVKKANMKLELGGAKVQVQALDNASGESQLMTGNYQGFTQKSGLNGSKVNTQRLGDTITVTMSTVPFGRNGDNSDSSNLELNLSTKVHYDMDISAGAINGTIDLSKLAVDNFKLSTGASKFDLQFGDTGIVTQGKIDSGASKLTLVVPEKVGLKIHFSGVASSSNFMGSGLFLEDKNWVSSNYSEAKTKIDLDISAAAGSIQLERPMNNIQ